MLVRLPKFLSVAGLFFVFFLVFSCSPDLEPGKIYEVSAGAEEGIFVPQEQDGGSYLGVFYIDRGKLYADRVNVEVKRTFFRTVMLFPDGEKRRMSYKVYESPKYIELPEVRLYTKPIFDVEVSQDEVYGHSKGFWTSYPCTYRESFALTFGRKTIDLVSMDEDLELTMDVYTPVGDEGNPPRPLFLMMHGGAFFNGDKQDNGCVAWCEHFASLGYVAASINYRLGFRPTHNEIQRAGYRAVQDANAAIRYLINQSRLNIDPERVFVAGTSAGAITALNTAFMTENYRPSITKGGRLGDEGAIDSVSPEYEGRFEVRAVGNMWGALHDLDMLRDRSIPVISFHGAEDPLVPFNSGYPFQSELMELVSDFASWFMEDGGLVVELLSSISPNRLLFDKMYGSYSIDRELKRNGIHSELYEYEDDRHSLHLDEDGSLNDRFDFIQDKLTTFFSDEMESRPASPGFSGAGPQVISINSTHVNRCYWQLEGGVFRSLSRDKATVLLFPDAPVNTLTVQGEYLTGMTFKETIEL